jgi:type III pantothenate kinase
VLDVFLQHLKYTNPRKINDFYFRICYIFHFTRQLNLISKKLPETMLVLIDIGNTNIKCALVSDNKVKHTGCIDIPKEFDWKDLSKNIASSLNLTGQAIERVVVSCVVPRARAVIEDVAEILSGKKALFVDEPELDCGINFLIDSPAGLGADRKAAIVGGKKNYGGDLIIFDFGTAITVEVTNSRGDYLGGLIVPGIGISKRALIDSTKKLEDFELRPPKSLVTTEVNEAMRSGIYYSSIAMIEGISNRIKQQYDNNKKIIATGGTREFLDSWELPVDIKDTNLIFDGMIEIYNRNKN